MNEKTLILLQMGVFYDIFYDIFEKFIWETKIQKKRKFN